MPDVALLLTASILDAGLAGRAAIPGPAVRLFPCRQAFSRQVSETTYSIVCSGFVKANGDRGDANISPSRMTEADMSYSPPRGPGWSLTCNL